MLTFPNAKINLGLNVISKRDDGFHNIETVFYPVPWMDVLEIIEQGTLLFEYEGLEIPGDTINNLCLKAYKLVRKDHKIPHVHIYLYKNIPTGAGLGGGSSDAAFMLNLLHKKFELNLGDPDKSAGQVIQLKKYAAELGSDCAFFIENKPAFATGKGDELHPLELDLSGKYIVIIYPKIHIDTGWAYSQINPARPEVSVNEIVQLPPEQWQDKLFNDFEKPVFEKYPEIKNIKDQLINEGAVYSAMSGSGSAVYGIFDQNPDIGQGKFSEKYIIFTGKL